MSRRGTTTVHWAWPDAASDDREGTPREVGDAPEILFGVQGDPGDERAIRALRSLCWGIDQGSARLRLVHVLTVPMTLPLDAELPEADATAAGILGRANLVAAAAGISARTPTVRARTVAGGLAEDARWSSARGIVVSLRHHGTIGAHLVLSRTVRTLLKTAPCPVYLLHLPHAERGVHTADESRRAPRRKRNLRGWVHHLWQRMLVGCVIADTSASESCGTCASARPYLEETLRIRALGRVTPRF